MNKKPFAYFLCAVVLILVAISPFLITSFFAEPSASKSFVGIIEMWHISDWRTGGSSIGAFLSRRISEFEDNNPHVFIRMQRMTLKEAKLALQSGKMPDIISYPPSLETNLINTVPYIYGAYYVIVNVDIAGENDIELIDSWGIRPDTLLEMAEFGLVYDAEENYTALPAVALHEYPDAPSPNITTWDNENMPDIALCLNPAEYFDGLEVFLDGEAGVLIASQRQLFELSQAYERNEGPAFIAYAMSGYTDMVQYLGVYPSEETLRQNMSQAFSDYLVANKTQKKMYALGVFPSAYGIGIYQDNECNAAIYSLLQEKPAIVSLSDQETLIDLTLRSFAGDRSSLRRLRKMLLE